MLRAVTYLHENNVVHRDLKLENWLYISDADDASLKLIDFGFSTVYHTHTTTTNTHTHSRHKLLCSSPFGKLVLWKLIHPLIIMISRNPPGLREFLVLRAVDALTGHLGTRLIVTGRFVKKGKKFPIL